MSVNIESLINSIQNEPPIWNSSLNASEEEKELSWARICEAVGCDRGR
jgi:hypothetical protein